MSVSSLNPVIVYADGSCLGNPGPGGYAAIMRRGDAERILTGGELHTTNNRMELMGPIQALQSMLSDAPIVFRLDSKYVVDGANRWLARWVGNGWRTAQGKPVKNADLWQSLMAALGNRKVTWEWTKGHADDATNNECDRLARAAAEAAAQGAL